MNTAIIQLGPHTLRWHWEDGANLFTEGYLETPPELTEDFAFALRVARVPQGPLTPGNWLAVRQACLDLSEERDWDVTFENAPDVELSPVPDNAIA